MHLELLFPSPWIVKRAPAEQFAALLMADKGEPNAPPQVVVTFGPLLLRPDEPKRWQEGIAVSDVPRGARAKLGRTLDHETASGWPMRLIEVEVTREADGALVEVRLCAFFTFLEHATAAIVRTGDRETLEQRGPAILDILRTGRPRWSGATTPVASLWDLAAVTVEDPAVARPRGIPHPSELAAALVETERQLATEPTASVHLHRGRILLAGRQTAEAIEAFKAALALEPDHAGAHAALGTAYGAQDRHIEAIAAWRRAQELAPRGDTQYNIGQAQFFLGQHEEALASFRAVLALAPDDFLALRKVVQCLYALGRFEEGETARSTFRRFWERTSDPRARLINEYVFDQFEGQGFSVHAIEVLRSSTAFPTLFVFQAVAIHGQHDHPLGASLHVETSDVARAAGQPFVLGVRLDDRFHVIAALEKLPPYSEMKREVARVLAQALAQSTT